MPPESDHPVVPRVLIVEDEFLCVMSVQHELAAAGMTTVACGTIDAALEAIRTSTIHLAVLDLNVQGRLVTPVAAALAAAGIPFLFVTGYDFGHPDLAPYADRPCLWKPIDPAEFVALARRLIAAAPSG